MRSRVNTHKKTFRRLVVELPDCVTEDGVLLRFLIDEKTISEARSVSYRSQPAELFQVPRCYAPLLAPEGGPVP
jgi:hypothetical protein